jgi:hypothetical protein
MQKNVLKFFRIPAKFVLKKQTSFNTNIPVTILKVQSKNPKLLQKRPHKLLRNLLSARWKGW